MRVMALTSWIAGTNGGPRPPGGPGFTPEAAEGSSCGRGWRERGGYGAALAAALSPASTCSARASSSEVENSSPAARRRRLA
jgi:hypothetical protein